MNKAFENGSIIIGKYLIACKPKILDVNVSNTVISVIRNRQNHKIIGLINIDISSGKLWFNPDIDMMFDSECLNNISNHINKFKAFCNNWNCEVSYD
ncbi:MAG: hypothetical protein WCR19_04560 [Acholeplasmataceae bacterium]